MTAKRVDGYMIEVYLDGERLLVRGKNKAAKVALAGADWESDVVVPLGDIVHVTSKPATVLTNGNLTVTTIEGRRYQLHYRRKSQEAFDALAAALPSA